MNKSALGAAIVVMIGIVGTIASLVSMPHGPLQIALTVIFALLVVIGLLAWAAHEVSLANAWSILRECKRLGIRRINSSGLSPNPNKPMSAAGQVRIMAVSANALIKSREQEIINALVNQRATIQVLLAQPDSEFVRDVEEAESPRRIGQISGEIRNVENMLLEYVDKACEKKRGGDIGKVQLGYYSTHLRSGLVLCDEKWGWMTPILSPKRAVHSVSLELGSKDGGLLNDCIQHFDRCWQIAEARGQVHQLFSRCDPAK